MSIKYYATEDYVTWENLPDKPFGVDLERTLILPETSGSRYHTINLSTLYNDLIPDYTYEVILDNVTYPGILDLVGPVKRITIQGLTVYIEITDPNSSVAISFPSNATHTISLYRVEELITPLALKFLPEHTHSTYATKAYVEELIGGIENGSY